MKGVYIHSSSIFYASRIMSGINCKSLSVATAVAVAYSVDEGWA